MKTKAAPEGATGAAAGEQPTSGNISVAQLGEMMKRKSAPAAKAATSPPAKEGKSTEATESEQPEPQDDDTTDLLHAAQQTDDGEATSVAASAEDAEGDEAGAETEVEGEGEQAEGEEEEPVDAAKQAKAVKSLTARVHKLVDQRDSERVGRLEAERKLAEAEARVAELQSNTANQTPTRQSNEQFGHHPEITKIDKRLAEIEAYLDWAEENPNGGSFEDNGKTYELTQDEIRVYRKQSERERINLNSTRAAKIESLSQAFNAQRKEAFDQAVKLYPWIEKKGTKEFQEAVRIIRENPGVLQRADFHLIVARQVVGEMMEKEAMKKATATLAARQMRNPATSVAANAAKPTPVVTHSPTAQPRVKARPTQEAETQFKTTGRVGDLAKLLAEKKRLKQEAA